LVIVYGRIRTDERAFLWQLVGDVVKLAAWLLAYLMLAKAMTKTFIITEIAFSVSFVLLSIWLVNVYGLIGMSYSFAINYGLYLIVMIYATKSEWSGESTSG
jgi:PST family polysaccharide transporter